MIVGDGEVIAGVQIWEGKTDAVLPPAAVRHQYSRSEKKLLFFRTHNHWATHETKIAMLRVVWDWTLQQWQQDKMDGEPRCVYFLDCWSVNLTPKLREEVKLRFPGMRLLFIPARGTGRFQINDTHLHRPLKAAIHRAANEWRISMVMQFRSDMEAAIQSGKNSDQERRLYQGRVSSLMAKDKLRLHASEWQWQGIERILEKDEDGRNLISRGWGNLYFTEAEAPGAAAKAFAARSARELQRLKLLGEETVAAARESRDPIAVLSEEEKLAKEQDVAIPVPEGPKDRYFGKKQRPKSTAMARSVTAGRRAGNQAAATVEAKEDAHKQKQAAVSKVKKMASKAKRHNAGELVSQPAVAAAPAPAVVAATGQREKRKRKFNSKYQDGGEKY
jgi:hypothetical protein